MFAVTGEEVTAVGETTTTTTVPATTTTTQPLKELPIKTATYFVIGVVIVVFLIILFVALRPKKKSRPEVPGYGARR